MLQLGLGVISIILVSILFTLIVFSAKLLDSGMIYFGDKFKLSVKIGIIISLILNTLLFTIIGLVKLISVATG